ncbi:MAG TPA: hypothetical protein VII94_00820 [Candidatus Saccharimonadales bacterium]
MKKLDLTLALGIGDNLVVRTYFNTIKHNYEQINITHSKPILQIFRDNDREYAKFVTEMGNLLFTQPPYRYNGWSNNYPVNVSQIVKDLKIIPIKPDLDHLLCVGTSLNLKEEYIVVTTKARCFNRSKFYPLSVHLWGALKKLSEKYKIVILGEREVEKSKEYTMGINRDYVFGIYDQLITNIPADRIIDLSVPALGISVPEFSKIKQDCLIMKNAKAVVTLGIGGNLWLSAISSNMTIGYRDDAGDQVMDTITNPSFPSMFLTKNFPEFIKKLSLL